MSDVPFRDALRPGMMPTRTKIVATVGPASESSETIQRMIEAGVSVFRFNFSHGTLEEHALRLQRVRELAAQLDAPVAVLGDLQGPKIRIGKVPGGGIHVGTGTTIIIQREAMLAVAESDTQVRFSSTTPSIIDDVQVGQRLLINDGAIRTLVVEASRDELTCTVTHGGEISSGKGINLPDTDLSLSTISPRDRECITWAVDHELDYLALSFVRSPADIQELRAAINQRMKESDIESRRLPIIAKIEVPRALNAIEDIVQETDAIMVARGDLGVEMDLAEVPVIQKRLSLLAQHYGTPCIVATQMLESMMHQPVPTRAEANDVANAIFDQVDAVMLSGETAVGEYPVITVEHMARIARNAEAYLATLGGKSSPPSHLQALKHRTAAMAHGTWNAARDAGACAVVVWSEEGTGARLLSQNNFHVPIFAVTSDLRAARIMQLLRGVQPICMELPPESIDQFERTMDAILLERGVARQGECYVMMAGEPLGVSGVTDTVRLHYIGEA
jgi:pyruvate kinase